MLSNMANFKEVEPPIDQLRQEFLKTTPPQQYDHATAIEVRHWNFWNFEVMWWIVISIIHHYPSSIILTLIFVFILLFNFLDVQQSNELVVLTKMQLFVAPSRS